MRIFTFLKKASYSVLFLIVPMTVGATDLCDLAIGSGNCANTISMEGDGVQTTTITFGTTPMAISSNFNITGIPVCYTVSVDSPVLTINWNSPEAYEQYAGSINALLFYNNSAESGECQYTFTNANGKNSCGAPVVVAPEIGAVTVGRSVKGSAILSFSLKGTKPITLGVSVDGTALSESDFVYSNGKLTITSSLLTVGDHSIDISATNSEGSDSKTGISVSTADKTPSCGSVNGLFEGQAVDYTFETNDDYTVTATIVNSDPEKTITSAILYMPGGGYTMSVANGVATFTTEATFTDGQVLSDIYFMWNDGTGETNSDNNKVSYTVGTVCHDFDDPVWKANPTFQYATKRTVVFQVNASDNFGIAGFNITFGNCDQTFYKVAKTTSYNGTLSVTLPEGCPDLTESAISVTLQVKDRAGMVSSVKTVTGVKKTDSEPVMSSVSCMPYYLKSSVMLAVEAQKGTNDIVKYHVVCDSPVVDKYVSGSESGTITVDGLASDKSYTFKVWAVDSKDLVSEDYVEVSVDCITASEPAIVTNLAEGYAYRGSEVKLTAVGFDAESTFVWESATKQEGPWTTISGSTNTVTVYPMQPGANFYRVTGVADGESTTVDINILAKISCDASGASGQQVVWKETFDDNVFTNPTTDRFECKWVTGYTFATWDNNCAAGEEGHTGKVCDGYYVVVANSTAAFAAACGWPENKYDHTSGDGTSGFLIINAGDPKKVMYEQTIAPSIGFCSGVYYNFSLFATNIASSTSDPARFSFDIVQKMNDGSEVYLVKDHDSGKIKGSYMENWYEYGVSFMPQDVDNIKQIVVRVWNTGASNDGNDVVIDDISVSICKPTASAYVGDPTEGKKSDTTVACGAATELNAVVNGIITDFFANTPYYAWQKKVEGTENWVEISGEHNSKLNYLTTPEEAVSIRCLVATDESTASLVISGSEDTGCGTYAWTDELYVHCDNNCENPAYITRYSYSGDQTQSVCAGTEIVPIIFELSGSATGFSIENLPEGLTVSPEPAAVIDDWIAISGIPTTSGTFTISTIGQQLPCTPATITGTVTVIPNPTIEENVAAECAEDLLSYAYSVKVSGGTVLDSVIVDQKPKYEPEKSTIVDKGNNIWEVTAEKDYSVKLTVWDNGCKSDLMVVAPDCSCPKINAPIGAVDKSYCKGDDIPALSVDAPASGYRIDWYDAATGGNLVATGASFTPETSGDYYAETVHVESGCTSKTRTKVTLTEHWLPIANIVGDNATCADAEFKVKGTGGTSFSWNGGEYTTSDTYSVNTATPGNKDVKLTVKDDNGCISPEDTKTIFVRENPIATISGSTAICYGDTATLGFDISKGTPDYKLTYSVSGETQVIEDISTLGTSLDVNPTSTTVYKLTKVEDTYGCYTDITNQSVTVTVNPIPTIAVKTSASCALDLLSYSVTVSVSDGTVTCDKTASITNVGNDWTISGIPAGEDCELYVTSEFGCSDTLSVVAPDCSCPSIDTPTGNSSSYCEGTEAPTPLVITSAVGADYKVYWYDANMGNVGEGTSFTPQTPGTYTAKVTYIYNESCQSSGIDLTQTANARPTVQISANSEVLTCAQEQIEISAYAEGGSQTDYTYSWNNEAYSSQSTLTVSQVGDYSAKVKDGNGCVSETSQTITITSSKDEPKFDINASATTLNCEVKSVTLTAVSKDDRSYDFEWVNGPSTSEYTVQDKGTYTVKAVEPQSGCSAQKSIEIYENLTESQITVSTNTGTKELTCKNETITLTASADNATFKWVAPNATLSETAQLTVDAANTYTVEATNKDSKCVSSLEVVITEDKVAPDVRINAEASELTCEKQAIVLSADADTDVTYKWSTGAQTASITIAEAAIYSVEVTAKGNGCQSSDEVEIGDNRTFTKIELNAIYPTEAQEGSYMLGSGPIDMEVTTIEGENPSTIDWYVNNVFVTSSDEMSFEVSPYTDSQVRAVAHSACNTDEQSVNVKVEWPTVVTPTIIDGYNDSFVEGLGIEIRLFDRNGNMQYHGYDGIPVDAMSKLQPGVYYYQAILPDGNVRKSTLEIYVK